MYKVTYKLHRGDTVEVGTQEWFAFTEQEAIEQCKRSVEATHGWTETKPVAEIIKVERS